MSVIIGSSCVFYFECANTCMVLDFIKVALMLSFCLFLHHQEAETGFVPSVQDFDKKLAEADAYLQILIDQLKVGATPN